MLFQDNKQCFEDDVLPDGSSVSKGDIVFYVPYAMGRMEYLWGKDAEVFRPERWLDQNGEFQQESPFKFTAFQVRYDFSFLNQTPMQSCRPCIGVCSDELV